LLSIDGCFKALASVLALALGVLLPAGLCTLVAATAQIPSTSWVTLSGAETET